MSTIHRIADSPPQFPCWIFHKEVGWKSFRAEGHSSDDWGKYGWTHWHPDQPEPPQVRPIEPQGGAESKMEQNSQHPMIFKQPRNIRARKMWERPAFYVRPDFALSEVERKATGERPVFVLPADTESYSIMEEALQKALHEAAQKDQCWGWEWRRALVRSSLAALGIHPPKPKSAP